MNLLEMTKGAINSQVAAQIGTALGIDGPTATSAINAALPAIFGGLARQASTPAGAASVFGALDRVDATMVDNLGAALSGGKLQSLIELGTKLLPTIFGSNYSSVFATLGRITGLGTGKIGPLLGMLAPIVIGMLAKVKKSSGLDLTAFSRLLMDQKENLTGLDSGLVEQLGLGSVGGPPKQILEPTSHAMPSVAESTRVAPTRGFSKISMWLIPILALAAVGVALYLYVFTRDGGEFFPITNQDTGAANPTTMTPGMRPRPAPDTEEAPPAKQEDPSAAAILDFVKDASKTFAEIKDEASAKTAAESLQKLAAKVDSLNLEKLAGPAKAAATTALKKFLDEAKAWAEKAYASPGVKEILEPAVNAIVDKLKKFAE